RELIELDLKLCELGADGLLQELDRAFRDRRFQIVLDVVGDPARNSRSAQWLELDARRFREKTLVLFGASVRDEQQHKIRRRGLDAFIEHLARRLFERADVAHDDHAPLGHHWWSADDRTERLRVDLRAPEYFKIEIARRRIDGRVDEAPDFL